MITGKTLRDAIISGANNIANQRTRVDELNVFPVLALPPRWARKEFCVVVCAALLTFVCMLRYWMWNVVPIWFLYSSVLMVVRCADLRSAICDLVLGFFGTYSGTLGRSGPCILRYLW